MIEHRPVPADAEALCRSCGMCCDGTLFSTVAISDGERQAIRALGMAVLETADGRPRFQQPCIKLSGTSCAVYADRPVSCRAYRCRVLRRLETGELTAADARARVGQAAALAASIRDALPAADQQGTSIWRRVDALIQADNLTGAEFSQRHPHLGMHLTFLRRLLRAEFRVAATCAFDREPSDSPIGRGLS